MAPSSEAKALPSFTELSDRLFAPNLKPPRIVYTPTPPSLAGSKLPPPMAEIDERPRWRVRRFRLWRDNAPSLLLAVLDPKRREHLKRYQPYVLPYNQGGGRGVVKVPVEPALINKGSIPFVKQPLILPRTPYPGAPHLKISKPVRKLRHQRLLQNKYALDQEHERRFRRGMRVLIQGVVDFEDENLSVLGSTNQRWKRDEDYIDLDRVVALTQFFKDIRKKSTNIYRHLLFAQIPIYPVVRRDEVHQAVKAEEKRKEKKEARKADKLSAIAKRKRLREANDLVALERTDEMRAGEGDELDAMRSGMTIESFFRDLKARQEVISSKAGFTKKRDLVKKGNTHQDTAEVRTVTPLKSLKRGISASTAGPVSNTNTNKANGYKLGKPAYAFSDDSLFSSNQDDDAVFDVQMLGRLITLMSADQRLDLSSRLQEISDRSSNDELNPVLESTGHQSDIHEPSLEKESTAIHPVRQEEKEESLSSFESSYPDTGTVILSGDLYQDEDTARIQSDSPDYVPSSLGLSERHTAYVTETSDIEKGDTVYGGESEADTIVL